MQVNAGIEASCYGPVAGLVYKQNKPTTHEQLSAAPLPY